MLNLHSSEGTPVSHDATMGLSGDERTATICLAVLTPYRVGRGEGQTNRQTACDSIHRDRVI